MPNKNEEIDPEMQPTIMLQTMQVIKKDGNKKSMDIVDKTQLFEEEEESQIMF